MTSSLVGSGDVYKRQLWYRDGESCELLVALERRELLYMTYLQLISSGSVSYTHLTLPTICSV
eukprot:6115569-Prorocentrum_lima.AAC.1